MRNVTPRDYVLFAFQRTHVSSGASQVIIAGFTGQKHLNQVMTSLNQASGNDYRYAALSCQGLPVPERVFNEDNVAVTPHGMLMVGDPQLDSLAQWRHAYNNAGCYDEFEVTAITVKRPTPSRPQIIREQEGQGLVLAL